MNKPINRDRMYAEFGLASHMAQGFELEAGNTALHFKTLSIDFGKVTSTDRKILREVTAEVNKKTLGALLKQVKKRYEFDDSAKQIVASALDKRNHLAHHFFRTHNFSVNHAEGCNQMISELKEMQNIFMEALRHLSELNGRLDKEAKRLGVKKLAADLAAKGNRVEI